MLAGTWVLKENTKLKLKVFERKVLRRIYGPTKENDGTWRINPLNAELNPVFHLLALLGGATIVVVSRLRVKSNEELNRLIGNKNIINHIKAQILACLDMYIECQIIAW